MKNRQVPIDRALLGDCLELLKELPDESISLIYLDPPFFTQRKHSLRSRSSSTVFEFQDTWDSLDHYLDFMRERLVGLNRVLNRAGSIFLHCDSSASHHLRQLLDEVFGPENFRSEIIWTYKRWTNSANGLIPSHQNIFYYSKSKNYTFNKLFGSYSETTNLDQILQLRQKGKDGVTKYQIDDDGQVQFGENKAGVPLGDTWEIPFLNPKAKERVGYPTQKPLILLERIIELASHKGDIVLDPFCGSGTTLVAAKLLGRKFIGFDVNIDAINLATERLEKPVRTVSQLLEKGRHSFSNADQLSLNHLAGLEFHPVQRNKGIDAFLNVPNSKSNIPVKIQKPTESVAECVLLLEKACKGKGISQAYVIRTRPDVELFLEVEVPAWIKVLNSVKMQIQFE